MTVDRNAQTQLKLSYYGRAPTLRRLSYLQTAVASDVDCRPIRLTGTHKVPTAPDYIVASSVFHYWASVRHG